MRAPPDAYRYDMRLRRRDAPIAVTIIDVIVFLLRFQMILIDDDIVESLRCHRHFECLLFDGGCFADTMFRYCRC